MRHSIHAEGSMSLHAQSDLLHQDANAPIKQPFTEDCRCGMYALEAWSRSLRLTQYCLEQPQHPYSSRKAASRAMPDGSCPASSFSCASEDSIVHHCVQKLSTCLAYHSSVSEPHNRLLPRNATVKVMASHAMMGSWTAHHSSSLCPKAERRTGFVMEPSDVVNNICVSY